MINIYMEKDFKTKLEKKDIYYMDVRPEDIVEIIYGDAYSPRASIDGICKAIGVDIKTNTEYISCVEGRYGIMNKRMTFVYNPMISRTQRDDKLAGILGKILVSNGVITSSIIADKAKRFGVALIKLLDKIDRINSSKDKQ